MLRVTVERVPHGDEAQAERLGTLRIANDGTGGKAVASYDIELDDQAGAATGRVDYHPRAWGFWPLVVRAIEACLGRDLLDQP